MWGVYLLFYELFLWRVTKCLINTSAFLIRNSMLYQQGLVRGTKDSDTLPKVPKSRPYGQKNNKEQGAWSRTVYLWTPGHTLHLNLLHLPWALLSFVGLPFNWDCWSSRTSCWFWWTNEIVTTMCLLITVFDLPCLTCLLSPCVFSTAAHLQEGFCLKCWHWSHHWVMRCWQGHLMCLRAVVPDTSLPSLPWLHFAHITRLFSEW